ncbi:MAG TPA: alpha/beta hydrolase [Cyanobacteria bacterium UBA8553]|nr:alpha/beta hydrolase [Cyanobacteria bacterium UBA8553]HAJ58049.1 alpha/beta hydrolase [Cyanobacteria bacterium UBA8543]
MPEVKSRPCFLTPGRVNANYPLFVFLPGMDGTGQLLRSQTKGLETAFDVRCLAIPPDDLTNWEDLTLKVVNLVEEELKKRSSRSVYLCGESFGGCLAIKVALEAPYLFDRIILVNPASSFNQRPWLLWGAQLNRLVPDNLYGVSALALLPFLSNLAKIAPSDRRALLKAMQSVPAKTANWRISLVSEFDVDEMQLGCLTPPVLVIAGGADRLLPSVHEAERLVNCLPDAKMVVISQSGHACLLETDVNLFEIMKDHNFLEASVPNQDAQSVLIPLAE